MGGALLPILSEELITIFGIICALQLITWRFSVRKTLAVASTVSVLLIALTAICEIYGAHPHLLRTIFMPAMLGLTFYLSEYRDMRTLYCNITSALFTICGAAFTTLAGTFEPIIGFFIGAFIYAAVLLLTQFGFRRTLHNMMRVMTGGWLRFCILPLILSATLSLFSSEIQKNVINQTPTLLAGLLLLGLSAFCTYAIIGFNFTMLTRKFEVERENSLLAAQVSALTTRIDLAGERQKYRILKHDIHHYSSTIRTLAQHENYNEILNDVTLLEQAIEALHEGESFFTYCDDPALDATLTTYIDAAKKLGINVSASILLPPALSQGRLELAVVFANAIENATNACNAMPKGSDKQIIIRSFSAGSQWFIEIANTYYGSVRFDRATGRPVTEKDGHGIGTQSIAAFADKNGALLSYSANNGWFKLRLVM